LLNSNIVIEYLFGTKISRISRFVYIAMVLIGAFGSLGITVSFLDISLASLVIINMFGMQLFAQMVLIILVVKSSSISHGRQDWHGIWMKRLSSMP